MKILPQHVITDDKGSYNFNIKDTNNKNKFQNLDIDNLKINIKPAEGGGNLWRRCASSDDTRI